MLKIYFIWNLLFLD